MQKIIVIGCCGAGKSTFSKKLSTITGLELLHLDQYYWKPNWEESDSLEWQKTVKQLADKPAWIIDGNYRSTLDIRLKQADTIIYLDYPTLVCLWRITKRIIKYRGKERPDMGKGCKERFDLEFYHYVATFNSKRRKKLLKTVNSLPPNKQVFIFKNDKETAQFLENCATQNPNIEA